MEDKDYELAAKQVKEKEPEFLALLKEANERNPMSYEDLMAFAAKQMAGVSVFSDMLEESLSEQGELSALLARQADLYAGLPVAFLELVDEQRKCAVRALLSGMELQRSSLAKKGADAVHNKPGGSREKQEKIRAIWASGKYSSRDICAEQECAALGMSISTARKALRNTPDPEQPSRCR